MKRKLITTLLTVSVIATLALTGCNGTDASTVEVSPADTVASTNSGNGTNSSSNTTAKTDNKANTNGTSGSNDNTAANSTVADSTTTDNTAADNATTSDSVQPDNAENAAHIGSDAEPATESLTEAQTEAIIQAPAEVPNETVTEAPTETAATSASASNGYYKDMAKQVWEYVNAERTANGKSALAWDESIYSYACQRAPEIITDFSHDKNNHSGYGENILSRPESMTSSAYDIHMQWYNSPGHHTNYMNSDYVSGACAIYYYNGTYYAVQNFMVEGTRYTASNGVSVIITPNGGISYIVNDSATQQAIAEAQKSSQMAEAKQKIANDTAESEANELLNEGYTAFTASNGLTIYYKHNGRNCDAVCTTWLSDESEAETAFAEHDATHNW
jgi:uncharacterized protein YkwD